MSNDQTEVVCRRDGRVATITLDPPGDQNRLTRPVLLALQGIVDEPQRVAGLLHGDPQPRRAGQCRAVAGLRYPAGGVARDLGCPRRSGAGPRVLAARIAASGPLGTRGAKRIVSTRLLSGLAEARALSDTLRHALEWSHDIDEGAAAHREERTPRFTGR